MTPISELPLGVEALYDGDGEQQMAGHPQHMRNGRGGGGGGVRGNGLLQRRNKLNNRTTSTTTEFPGLSQLESGGRHLAKMMSGGGGGKVAQTEQTFLADADGCHKNGYNGVAAAAGENGNGGGYRRQQSFQLVSGDQAMKVGFDREQWMTVDDSKADPEGPGLCALLLTLAAGLLLVATLPLSLCTCIKVVTEYERAVIFRLGRLRKGGAKGPGIFFIIPCIDSYQKVDLRTVSFDVPPQEVLSRDSVTVSVDAVVYYRVSNPTMATNNIEDYSHSTRLLAATTLRNVLGTKNLAEILSERESISHVMQTSLDDATDPWGVKVERVEIKDVRLPVQLQRAMAAEAEAAREARAKVIAAEGEQKASKALRMAAETISDSHGALQLRYLQTLNSISAEKNSTIIFPFPVDLLTQWTKPASSPSPESQSPKLTSRKKSPLPPPPLEYETDSSTMKAESAKMK